MKKITNNKELNENSYYGVLWGANRRGFITQIYYCTGNYTVRSMDGITHANGWSGFDHPTLEEVANDITKYGGKVFEFATGKHLARWLSRSS